MAAPTKLSIEKWNEAAHAFHNESDRGAALLAGSFVEHSLGTYLRSKMVNPEKANELFDGAGPLATFSQRIAIGYAFGFLPEEQKIDLELIRRIRNHFAHHPMETSFQTSEIQQRASQLSTFSNDTDYWPSDRQHRYAYLIACGLLCAFFEVRMAKF